MLVTVDAPSVVANRPDLAKATVVESQVPTQVSGNTITLTVNAAHFHTGDQAFLFYFDPATMQASPGFGLGIDSMKAPRQKPARKAKKAVPVKAKPKRPKPKRKRPAARPRPAPVTNTFSLSELRGRLNAAAAVAV